MIIKREITAILNKPMDRQGFLKHIAIGVVALTGAGAALKLLAPEQQQPQAHAPIDHGYGGSAYGGNDEGSAKPKL